MKNFSLRRLGAALLFCAIALVPLARAHDPLQAWATATVRPDGIEINMVLSTYPSQTLIDKELKRPPLSPENFDTYKAELETTALGLFEITDGGQPLKATSASTELTEESDIQYHIFFPAPHVGPLHFRITYLDRILADAKRDKEMGYRDKALKMYPHVCGRCAREFSGKRLSELTVHHRDHNHDNNPQDGSNWELLCLYCHDNEHSRYTDQQYFSEGSTSTPSIAKATHNPFAGLANLLKKD